jgi:hypothetical protein
MMQASLVTHKMLPTVDACPIAVCQLTMFSIVCAMDGVDVRWLELVASCLVTRVHAVVLPEDGKTGDTPEDCGLSVSRRPTPCSSNPRAVSYPSLLPSAIVGP